MLQADIVRPTELSPRDRAAWAAFTASTPAFRSPLLSAEFAEAAALARDDAAIAVFRRRGAAVGFLAHHRRPGGLARPIGAPWSDYHALISAPDADIEGREALSAAGLSRFRFAGLLDPYAVFAEAEAAEHEAYLIELEGCGDSYWEGLRAASPKRFKNMRRLEHKLARELGEPTLAAPDHDQAAFDQLLAWKSEQLRRSGLHDVLQSAWSRSLMQSLFERRDGALHGLLISLKLGERIIAGHFGVRVGGAYHPWIAAYDPALAAYSPGQTFMSEVIRAMPDLQVTSYDLSAGSDHYKRPFASKTMTVREGELGVGAPGLSLDRLSAVLGTGAARTMRRMRRRLDHIAASELSLTGRVQGFAAALAGSSRRLEVPGAYAEGQA